MEFLAYRNIKGKLKKRGLLFKKTSLEDASGQFYTLARQLDDHKLYSGFCHLAVASCQNKKSSGQVGAFLNAARAFSQARDEIISAEDHVQLVVWVYTEALLICDRSFIRPIRLELGRFYESHQMFSQAAECFKQCMCISNCVYNLILAKRYQSALDELKNCPSHLLTSGDHTSMFLLELLLHEDFEELNRNSLHHLSSSSRISTNRGLMPIDDYLFNLTGLLESLLILQRDKRARQEQSKVVGKDSIKDEKIKNLIVDRLCAVLDPAQTQILHLIASDVMDSTKKKTKSLV